MAGMRICEVQAILASPVASRNVCSNRTSKNIHFYCGFYVTNENNMGATQKISLAFTFGAIRNEPLDLDI